jgi:hypothetical protein
MIAYSSALTRHPTTYSRWVDGIDVRIVMAEGGDLVLAFGLRGDLAHLRIPPPRTPRRAERLWMHTCFEAFIGPLDGPAYCEFNFAPSGEWAAYAFQRYREGGMVVDVHPAIAVQHADARLDLEARILRVDRLVALPPRGALRLGLAAVVEDARGALAYWALRHPSGRPDFHHAQAFALTLAGDGDGGAGLDPPTEVTNDEIWH